MGTEPSRTPCDCEDEHVPRSLKLEFSDEPGFDKVKTPEFTVFDDITELSRLKNYGEIFPGVVIHNIFLYLSPIEHLRASLSCKLLHVVGNTRSFWKNYYRNFFSKEKIDWCFCGNSEVLGLLETTVDEIQHSNFNWKRAFHDRYTCVADEYIKRKFLSSRILIDNKKKSNRTEEICNSPITVVIAGPEDSGRNAIVHRFVDNIFHEDKIDFRRGCAFTTRNFGKYTLEIWKKSRRRRYVQEPQVSLYRSGSIILLTFDLNNRASFDELTTCNNFLLELECWKAKKRVLLVGCKSDLEHMVSFEEASELARKNDFRGYVECSSKGSRNILMLFRVSLVFMKWEEAN